MHTDLESFEDSTSKKRRKLGTGSEVTFTKDFKIIFDDEFKNDDSALEYDEISLYMHLTNLVEHFDTASAVNFFKATESREESSKARRIIDCGRDWIRQLDETQVANILFAAISLGGSTLIKYRDCLNEFEK